MMVMMPELQELCGDSAPPLSIVHLEVDSLGSLAVASTPPSLEHNQSLDFVDSKALFAKELRDLVVSLEAAIHGSGNEIACLLLRKDSGGKSKR
jgi:hypothetical protein